MLVPLIVVGLGLIIFILSAPLLFAGVSMGVAGTGGASGLVIKLFPWAILFTIVAVFFRVLSGGGGFF